MKNKRNTSKSHSEHPQSITIKILECKILLDPSAIGRMESFFRIEYGAHTYKSSRCVGKSPRWEEEVQLSFMDGKGLTVLLLDRYLWFSEKEIGRCTIDPSIPSNSWHNLVSPSSSVVGALRIQCTSSSNSPSAVHDESIEFELERWRLALSQEKLRLKEQETKLRKSFLKFNEESIKLKKEKNDLKKKKILLQRQEERQAKQKQEILEERNILIKEQEDIEQIKLKLFKDFASIKQEKLKANTQRKLQKNSFAKLGVLSKQLESQKVQLNRIRIPEVQFEEIEVTNTNEYKSFAALKIGNYS